MNGMQHDTGGPTPKPAMAMEHPDNDYRIPPLVDDRVVSQFCRAVQASAGAGGMHDEAKHALQRLRGRLEELRSLAKLCRYAVSGMPHAFARLRDALDCLAADFPGAKLPTEIAPAPSSEAATGTDLHFAAVLDLFAGAAFVSKGDDPRRDRYVAAIVHAVTAAIAFPLAYAPESATYLGDASELPTSYAAVVIANATERLIEDDRTCAPAVPHASRKQLATLARSWVEANPVTTMFAVLGGPQVTDVVLAANAEGQARPGHSIGLIVEGGGSLADLGVMFCPHEPADVKSREHGRLQVSVPRHAASGPVAIVKRAALTPILTVYDDYLKRFPREMANSVFRVAPMNTWAFPYAFGGPHVHVDTPVERVVITAFGARGRLRAGDRVPIGHRVAIHYRAVPAGSSAGRPPKIDAPVGTITRGSRSDVVFYHPAKPGEARVEIGWEEAKAAVTIVAKEAS